MSHCSLPSLRPVIAGAAATAGLAMTFSSLSTVAQAQQTAPANDGVPQSAADDAVVLQPVTVEGAAGQGSGNVNAASPRSSRLPESVREMPRVVNVVPEEIIEQQRAVTLDQVLRNVPGITVSTGEGRGGQNGDQFRIRGLTARGDIYTDGLRDFGVYTHDVFNTESVQVIKGPSGDSFGVGTSGGLINQGTKKAGLDDQIEVQQSIGSGPLYRSTVDVNQTIGETSAIRLNAVYHDQDIADRDRAKSDRRGIAADLGLGIGTETNWHLNYSFLKGEKAPDMGQPMVMGADGIYRPAAEYGLDRSTSYIRNLDRDHTENHVVTSTLSHELNDAVTLYNDTRFSHYSRNLVSTTPGSLDPAASAQFRAGGNPNISHGAGGGMAYKQDGWGVQNISGARAQGTLFGLRHSANGGLDVTYHEDNRASGSWVNRVNDQTLVNPSTRYPANAFLTYPAEGARESTLTNVGVYVSDRVWLHEMVSIQGGLRWDHFLSKYEHPDPTQSGESKEQTWSPSASLIVEPTPESSVYLSFARSYKPVGTDIAAAVNAGTNETPNDRLSFDPERTDLYELGGKADFLDGRLGLTGAIFQIEKKDTYTTDPATGDVVPGFGEAGLGTRVRGFEAGVSGKITSAWTVYANYAYLTGEIRAAQGNPDIVGNDAPNVPEHNANLWTTYEFSTTVPGAFTVGGGVQYASAYWADTANTARMPESYSLDAMVSYEFENMSLALNGYNLTDHLNYASAFNSARAVPAPGRTFMLTASAKF